MDAAEKALKLVGTIDPPAPSTIPGRDGTTRYHHLDAVRAFALLLGVVFHAAESFGPHNHYWAIVDCSPTEVLEWFRAASHSFRLELFYLIAGFFARMVILKRGAGGFARDRLKRILVPLLVGWLVLYPLLVFIWLWGKSVSGQLGQFGVPPEAMRLPLWQMWLGFFMSGGFLRSFDLTHLWFLHQLLVLYAVMLVLIGAGAVLRPPPGALARIDRAFARLFLFPGAVCLFAAASAPIMFLMDSWTTVDTPKSSLLPHWPTTLLFGLCFLTGWLLHRQPDLLGTTARRWVGHMSLGVLAWLLLGGLESRLPLRGLEPRQFILARAAILVVYSLMMWGFMLGFLGLFTRFCQKPNAWVRYTADASYWIYIAHLPLVVALQVLLGTLPLPWPLKYALIILAALPPLFLSYHYLVRNTAVGALLNGRRFPREWPWESARQPGPPP
jgi:peptidoglycan/LPS O-acetylase OafA/YrhL